MFDSLIKDIKFELTRGNTVTRLILINCIVFLVIILSRLIMMAFSGGESIMFDNVIRWFTLPSDLSRLILQPWSLFTYAFMHFGIWHILFNMLLFYWFGRIAGDLIGDRRIFPLYFYGAILGGIFAVICLNLIPFGGDNKYILGASASVMAVIMASATLAPDYLMRLILLGNVKIKYIVAVLIILDLLSISMKYNIGGSFAHLGGAMTGYGFIWLLRHGYDPSKLFFKRKKRARGNVQKRRPVKVVKLFATLKHLETEQREKENISEEHKLDAILEKIKKFGKQSLSADELEFLEKISKS